MQKPAVALATAGFAYRSKAMARRRRGMRESVTDIFDSQKFRDPTSSKPSQGLYFRLSVSSSHLTNKNKISHPQGTTDFI